MGYAFHTADVDRAADAAAGEWAGGISSGSRETHGEHERGRADGIWTSRGGELGVRDGPRAGEHIVCDGRWSSWRQSYRRMAGFEARDARGSGRFTGLE